MTTALEYLRKTAKDMYFPPIRLQSGLSFNYTPEQHEGLRESFPTLQMAEEVDRNCCILLPTPPEAYNLLDLLEMLPDDFYGKQDAWYTKPYQLFARVERLDPAKWIAIRRMANPKTKKKTWNQQLDCLPSGLYVPRAVDLVYAMLVYHKLQGTRILVETTNRTCSVTSDGKQVGVGPFHKSGIVIRPEAKSETRNTLVIAAAVRLQSLE